MNRYQRISVVGKFYEDSFAGCIADAFGRAGHDVQRVDDQLVSSPRPLRRVRMLWARATELSERIGALAARRLASVVAGHRPDLLLCVSKTLHPTAVHMIKRATDAKAVFWFPDAISNLGRQYFLASPYDLLCFKDRVLAELLHKRLGVRTAFLPDAARAVGEEYSFADAPVCDLMIACNMYPYRMRLMESLRGFDWRIYGNWPRWLDSSLKASYQGRYLAGPAKIASYRQAAIVFNSNHPAELAGINARTFEVCGSGAFLLTDDHPSLPEYYAPGTEVGVYGGVEDLPEVVRFYLERPQLRAQMARRAYERTLREHLYEHRVTRLLEMCREL
jgi:spore maturation protein CgeB